ncbi:MAG: hypothetical protein LBJ89_00095 [Holosporales bacterium]|nr:hypothetical protein [Holosporales bacterium]
MSFQRSSATLSYGTVETYPNSGTDPSENQAFDDAVDERFQQSRYVKINPNVDVKVLFLDQMIEG